MQLRHALLGAAILAAVIAPAFAGGLGDLWKWSGRTWNTYESPDGVFTVSLLQKPSHRQETCDLGGGIKVPGEYYLVLNHYTAQEIEICDYSSLTTVADPIEFHIQILKSNGSVFTRDEADRIGDHAGRRIAYDIKEGRGFGIQRLFTIGKKLYCVYGGLPKDREQSQIDEVNHFVDSFQFTDSNPSKE